MIWNSERQNNVSYSPILCHIITATGCYSASATCKRFGAAHIKELTVRRSSWVTNDVGDRSGACQYLTCHSAVGTEEMMGVFYDTISPVSSGIVAGGSGN